MFETNQRTSQQPTEPGKHLSFGDTSHASKPRGHSIVSPSRFSTDQSCLDSCQGINRYSSSLPEGLSISPWRGQMSLNYKCPPEKGNLLFHSDNSYLKEFAGRHDKTTRSFLQIWESRHQDSRCRRRHCLTFILFGSELYD